MTDTHDTHDTHDATDATRRVTPATIEEQR